MTARRPALVALALALATGLLPASGALADPEAELGTARERAAALRAQVADLEVRAAAATEDYNAARESLARTVSTQILAERRLAGAEATSDAAEELVADRARALYMSGGRAVLYASVLEGDTLGDVLSRVQGVRTVVRADVTALAEDRTAVTAATRERDRVTLLTTRRTRLEQQSALAASRVRGLLASRRDLLADAGAEVRRLAEEQRRAEEAAAARRAAAALARAGAVPETGGAPPAGGLPSSGGHVSTGGDVPAAVGEPGTRYAERAIAEALRLQGSPYEWGAVGPDTFDCSGFTGWVYRHAGLSLPRTSREQWYAGRHVALRDIAPGDLLFWAYDTNDPGSIHHVAMYLGGGRMIHAPHTGDVVRVAPVYLDGYIGAVRPAA